ncbi:MAG: hypothetical protein R2788_23110 [Saprospiraceae bacterium]
MKSSIFSSSFKGLIITALFFCQVQILAQAPQDIPSDYTPTDWSTWGTWVIYIIIPVLLLLYFIFRKKPPYKGQE